MNQPSLFGPVATVHDTLAKAREELVAKIDDGTTCPCCKQHAQRYWRQINATMAACMIVLHKNGEPMTSAEVGHRLRGLNISHPTGDMSKLKYWGLIRPLGKKWELTTEGAAYVNRKHSVREFALVYNGECVDHEGAMLNIDDALGKKFDYDELMKVKS